MPGELRPPLAPFGFRELVKALAALFAGALFGLNCWLSPGFSAVFLPFVGGGGPAAFAWAAPAGVLMGLGFSLLGRAVKGGRAGDAGARLPLVMVAGFIVTVFLFVVEPLGTAQFFLLLFFLFPCAIMVYGAGNGRLWAVGAGALLQLLIGLGTALDGQNLPGLLAYGIVYLAALELSWSSAAMTATLERELSETAGQRGTLWARSTLDRAAGNYLARLLACGTAAAFAVALALSMFGSPGLFGPAYAASLEAGTAAGLLLPGAAVLSALAAGLLVPPDLWPRAKAFLARARLALRPPAVPARRPPEEKVPRAI